MTVYISGPITNNPRYREQFQKVAEVLRQSGHTVLDPTIWERDGVKLDYESYMHLDLAMVEVADAIAMLPGWEHSTGAQREMEHARKLNIEVIEIDPEWRFLL